MLEHRWYERQPTNSRRNYGSRLHIVGLHADRCQTIEPNRYHHGVYFDQRHLLQNAHVESLGVKIRREYQYETWFMGFAVSGTS